MKLEWGECAGREGAGWNRVFPNAHCENKTDQGNQILVAQAFFLCAFYLSGVGANDI